MNDLRRARNLGRRPTRARTTDIRARQARRKVLKLLRELFLRDQYNLPEELLPHVLTWVGYDLIHNFPGEYCYQTDQLWVPLPDPGRNRDPVYTGQKPIGGTAPKRSAPLVRVGTELRFELIARPERESDSESETIEPANQISILGTN